MSYWRTKWNGMEVCWEHPIAGKRQFRTSLAMHEATAGSSPEADTPCGAPSVPMVSETVTLADALCEVLRSQQARRSPTE